MVHGLRDFSLERSVFFYQRLKMRFNRHEFVSLIVPKEWGGPQPRHYESANLIVASDRNLVHFLVVQFPFSTFCVIRIVAG